MTWGWLQTRHASKFSTLFYAPEGRLSNSSPGSADWRRRAFFILDFVTVCHRPFLGRNSMFWPSREKIPVTPVEGRRCSDSYKSLLEEQVGWHTSLVRGNGSFSKKHTDSYAYILRRKIFANCEKNFAFCKKKSEEHEVYLTFIQVFWIEKIAGLIKMAVFTHLFVQHFMHNQKNYADGGPINRNTAAQCQEGGR